MMTALRVIDLVVTDDGRTFEPAGRMAAAIIELTQQNGSWLPQDLNSKGFTPDEVAAQWHMAESLAAVEIKLMGASPAKSKSLFGRR
jgi:hypothetical protein